MLSGYGCCVAVDLPPAEAAGLRGCLPPGFRVGESGDGPQRFWTMSAGPDGAMQAFANAGALLTDADAPTVFEFLLADLELWVAEHSTERVFLHAGCVAVGDLAIVLPGRSTTGKSRLVAELLAAGATYYSDEYALIDSDGLVWPYARPLRFRSPEGRRLRRVTAQELGAPVGEAPLRIGLVATLRYSPEAGLDMRSSRQGDAVLSLMDNSVAARRSPEAVLSALVAATEGVAAVEGTRSEAKVAAHELLDRLRAAPPAGAAAHKSQLSSNI